MALVGGKGYSPDIYSGFGEKEKALGSLKKVEKIARSTMNTAQTLDKVKETALKRSGLLSSKDFTITDTLINESGIPLDDKTFGTSIDIFERKPMAGSGEGIFHEIYDFGKEAFTGGVYDRVQVTDQALANFNKLAEAEGNIGGGAQKIGDLLAEKGFKEEQIRTVLGEWQEGYVVPEVTSKVTPGPSQITKAPVVQHKSSAELESLNNFIKEKVNWVSTTAQKGLTSIAEGTSGGFAAAKEGLEKVGFFPAASEASKHAAKGVWNVPIPGGATELLGKGVQETGKHIDKFLALGGKTGGGVKGVLGKAGQVAGLYRAGKALTEFDEDPYQATEDVVQGMIGFATPALLAAGPMGWTVLGLSFLEDVFFEDVIDLDW
jgi:hypothetical protein